MRIICISGKAQNGKDTSAEMIKGFLEDSGAKVRIIHYADLLKFICKSWFDWDGSKDEYGRTLLQRVGTDTIRAKEPDYWVEFVCNLLKLFPDEWNYVIIPDCRFPNEIESWNDTDFNIVSVRIVRYNEDGSLYENHLQPVAKLHPSEVALDGWSFDYEVENRGLKELAESAEVVFEDIEYTVISEEG